MKRGAHLLENALLAVVLMAVTGTVAFYTYFWQWNFNSDTVVSGLSAIRFLSHGDLPIFVGLVGYQGLLLEVPLIAASFSLFGVSPYSLNLIPTFFYLLLLFAFYRVCRVSFDRVTSRLALLFLALSPAQWFGVVMRSIPNYPQTYLAGLTLFLLYTQLPQKVRSTFCGLASEKHRSSLLLWIAFGLLAGFAFYTYGQIIYFLAAIVLHASLFYLRGQYKQKQSLRAVLFPIDNIAIRVLTGLSILFFFVAWIPWGELRLGNNRVDFVKCLFVSCSLIAFAHVLIVLKHYRKEIHAGRIEISAGLIAFLIGYFPKLYFNFILKQPSIQKFHIGGGLSDVFYRLGLLRQSVIECYVLDSLWVRVLFFSVLAFSLGWFVCSQTRNALRFIRAEIPIENFKDVSFGLPLFLCTLGALIVSQAFADLSAHRYAFALFLPLSMAFACACIKVARWKAGGVAVALLIACLVFLQTLRSYRQGEVYVRAVDTFTAIAQNLREKNIDFGYADYWYAFSIDFLHPDLALKPLYGNYVANADERVDAAQRIAVIEPRVPEVQLNGKFATIENKQFHVEETYLVAGIRVLILRRKN